MPESQPAAPRLVVTVTRTGGFTGIARVWHAEAPPAAYTPLLALVEACPWDGDEAGARTPTPTGSPGAGPSGPSGPSAASSSTPPPSAPSPRVDGFTWHVEAAEPRATGVARARTIPDQDMTGAWERLVDAVRAAPD